VVGLGLQIQMMQVAVPVLQQVGDAYLQEQYVVFRLGVAFIYRKIAFSGVDTLLIGVLSHSGLASPDVYRDLMIYNYNEVA